MAGLIRLLIADDDEVVRSALADFFASDDRFEVLPAAVDTLSAVALAREFQPDVVLVDVRMPGGGGPAAARAIKANCPNTRIVAVSAHGDPDAVLQMLESGAIGYVVKGGNPALILEAAVNAAAGRATLSPEVAGAVIETVAAQLRAARGDAASARVERFQDDEFSKALADGEFRLAYQPKVSLLRDRTTAVEGLLRWHHPRRGIVPPLDFIPLAEHSGLIVPIGLWVLEQACMDARTWSECLPGGQPLTVSVNVSPRQFNTGLAASFGAILARTGTDPQTLCLEVTEGTVMQEPEVAITTLRKLKALGCRVSIDDFGTGFSSLAYLKRFPLDELKIDKSFIDGLGKDPHDTAIVAAVMGMAHALDLNVVAEGVESAEQAARLRNLGCDEVQGYFYSRPISAAEVGELVRAEDVAKQEARQQHGANPTERTRADRVLVVDDAADVRQLARTSLTAGGFEVQEAASGEEAVAILGHFHPECVVLDINLPGMSGIEVCRLLRSNPLYARTTIVMLTVRSEAPGKAEAFSLEADDYIVKPFTPRDLVSRTRSAIRRRRAPLMVESA
jgi:EAL domain-containing protein (putative c-di-GMP-specific phosphodiesterase class I)/DNA-binding response OmpR family regulator